MGSPEPVQLEQFSCVCVSDPQIFLSGKQSTVSLLAESLDGSPLPYLIDCILTPPDNIHQPIKCIVESILPGQYKAVFTPITCGLHQLHVRVHDINIPGSPINIHVSLCPKTKDNPLRVITGLKRPVGVGVTDHGHIIVAEYSSEYLTVFDNNGEKVGVLEGRDKTAPFYSGVAVTPNGTILASDGGMQELTTRDECIAGIGSTQEHEPLQFIVPRGIAINKTTGQIAIVEQLKYHVLVLNRDFTFSHIIGGNKGRRPGDFKKPTDVTIDSKGFLYVTDTRNHRIQKFDSEGKFVDIFGKPGKGPGELFFPEGITVDQNDLLYVAESGTSQPKIGNHRVSIFTTNGKFVHSFGEFGIENGKFREPAGIAFDRHGHLYICDKKNSRIVIY